MSTHHFDSDPPRADFGYRVESRRGVVYVVPMGELDLDTTPQVEARLRELHEAGFQQLVLDLRETTFIDSTGVHLALAWQRRARRGGFGFGLVQGPDPVHQVIEAAGVADALRFVR